MITNNVIARLTVTRKDKSKVIVEVHADASFSQFYKFFTQDGSKRSTKTFTRAASRNEGLHHANAHLQVPGLQAIALQFIHNKFGSPVESTKIRIISKRAYQQLINARPDELGQVKVRALFDRKPVHALQPRGPLSFKLVEKINHLKIHAGALR